MTHDTRDSRRPVGQVLYSCPFVPAEWIVAHGLTAERIRPRARTGGVAAGFCPYAHAFVAVALGAADAAGVIVTTVCDQMRRSADVLASDADRPVFLMNVPATCENDAARGLYRSELERLGRFLRDIGGTAPTTERLANVMLEHDERRQSAIPGRVRGKGIPVALLGGPMFAGDAGVWDMVLACGGDVVLDGTESGERTLPARPDRARTREQPLEELVDAYFGAIPDPFRRPNAAFRAWVTRMVRERGVKGVVLTRHPWCDTWHAEVQPLRRLLDVPVMDVVVGSGVPVRHRIEAFMETIG